MRRFRGWGCEAVDEPSGKKDFGEESDADSIWVEFLQERPETEIPDAARAKELLHIGAAVAAVVAKIIWEETEAADRVVPPVVKIYNCSSGRPERTNDRSQ